jgi:cyclic-di-GMP-binding protein
MMIASRKISPKALDFKTAEKAFDGCLRQEVTLAMGIPQEKAKEIVKIIKDLPVKVQTAIQGDEIRVSSKSKDDLQSVMQHLKAAPLTLPLQFVNFR